MLGGFDLRRNEVRMSHQHDCECGRKYRVWATKMIMRDKDSLECECGRVIMEWNEAKIWHADMIKDPPVDPQS
jgi:hypothetical protein